MFRGNLAHTGVYDDAGVPKFNTVKWKFQTGGRVISSPAVVNGVAYVGSTDGSLYAIDAASGTLKWKFPTKVWITSSSAVASGLVYFESYDSNFYALDASTASSSGSFRPGAKGPSPARTCITFSQRPNSCPTLGISIYLLRACGTESSTFAAATAMSMRLTRNPEPSSGNFRPATSCTPRPPS